MRKIFRKLFESSPSILLMTVFAFIISAAVTALEEGFDNLDSYYGLTIITFIISSLISLIPIRWNKLHVRSFFDNQIIGNCFAGYKRSSCLFNKGFSVLAKEEYYEALHYLKDCESMLQNSRELAVVSYYIGRIYQAMGCHLNAARYYKQSIDNNLDIDDAFVRAGRTFTYAGCFSEAEECYKALLDRNSYVDFILTDLGFSYLKSGQSQKALSVFKQSADEGKNYSFALGGCSLAYLQMKDIEQSKVYYSKALLNNMEDIPGFKSYYCSIAEAVGCLDEIDPNMKKGGENQLSD